MLKLGTGLFVDATHVEAVSLSDDVCIVALKSGASVGIKTADIDGIAHLIDQANAAEIDKRNQRVRDSLMQTVRDGLELVQQIQQAEMGNRPTPYPPAIDAKRTACLILEAHQAELTPVQLEMLEAVVRSEDTLAPEDVGAVAEIALRLGCPVLPIMADAYDREPAPPGATDELIKFLREHPGCLDRTDLAELDEIYKRGVDHPTVAVRQYCRRDFERVNELRTKSLD